MKPYDVIAIGELNVDLLLNRIEGFPEIGKEKFAGDHAAHAGQFDGHLRRELRGAGCPHRVRRMIGRDMFGELVKRSLREKGVDTRFVIESGRLRHGRHDRDESTARTAPT